MESIENKELVKNMAFELKAKMRNGKVKFKYTKKNGEIRDALGTLNSDIYGKENEPTGNGYSVPEDQIRYYDLNSKGWRSFIIDNLISYE